MSSTNYGVFLERGDGEIVEGFDLVGEATSIDLPKYITDEESTSHSSSGVRTFTTSGLKSVDAFSATYNCNSSLITLIKTDMRAKTISNLKLTGVGDFNSILFAGFFKSFQILGADAQNPDVIKAQIEIQPTGSLTAE